MTRGGGGAGCSFLCPPRYSPSVPYDETYDFSYGLVYVAFGLPWGLVYGNERKMQPYILKAFCIHSLPLFWLGDIVGIWTRMTRKNWKD